MVHLAPASAGAPEYPARSDGEAEFLAALFERAALAPDVVEHVSDHMERVIVEFDLNARRAGKDTLVDGTDFRSTALDAAERIIHGHIG